MRKGITIFQNINKFKLELYVVFFTHRKKKSTKKWIISIKVCTLDV